MLTPIRWWHEARFEAHMRRAQRQTYASLRASDRLRLQWSHELQQRANAHIDRAVRHGNRADRIRAARRGPSPASG